ncbi:DUF2130 domain-containing protein [Candidatus Microgenomates bacterium]|nr:MAG: DUF2130 domain-containing protein [Candidatus Microgenomates bacterium]
MNVKCPSCGKEVEVSQAIKHQVEEVLRSELVADIEKKTTQKIKEEFDFKIKDQVNALEEKEKRNKQLQEQLLDLNKIMRELKDDNEKREIESQKKLNEEIEKIKESAMKTASEKARLKELELEKKLSDTQKALEDAQRKTQQGSQQLQGEVVELDFENQLKSVFAFDEFLPVPKGIEGADIWQKVKNKHGQSAGTIIWEIKRTKAWSKAWLPKLREDARKVDANVCILISDSLPNDIKFYDRQDGVWICSYDHAVVLAKVLRDSLLQIAIAKSTASHKEEKLQNIYNYITSPAFRNKIEGYFESVSSLRTDLEGEKRAMERVWKKREMQIQRLDRNMSQMFGDLQGIVPELPSIQSLELPQLDSGDEE